VASYLRKNEDLRIDQALKVVSTCLPSLLLLCPPHPVAGSRLQDFHYTNVSSTTCILFRQLAALHGQNGQYLRDIETAYAVAVAAVAQCLVIMLKCGAFVFEESPK